MERKGIFWLLAVTLVLSPPVTLGAYSLSGHKKITEKALEFIQIEEIQQFKQTILVGASGGTTPVDFLHSEDTEAVPDFAGSHNWARNLNHGYNPNPVVRSGPSQGKAWPTPPSECWNKYFPTDRFVMPAREWARATRDINYLTWDNAIALYKAGAKEDAYHILGHIAHLVEDMSIPAHVHIIDHGKELASIVIPDCIRDFYRGILLPDGLEEYLSDDPDNLLCCKTQTPRFDTPKEYIENLARFTHGLRCVVVDGQQRCNFFLDDGEPPDVPDGFGSYDPRGGLGLADACKVGSPSRPFCKAFVEKLFPQVLAHVVGLFELFWRETHATTPRLTFDLNEMAFRRAEQLILGARVTPGPTPVTADVYIALQVPSGDFFFWLGGMNFTLDVRPIVRNWTVAPFSGEIFRYTFSGGEPVGQYRWLAAFTEAGTLNIIGDIAQAPFIFSQTPTTPCVGPCAYITNEFGNSVSVIDTATNRVIATVAMGNTPRGVAVHPAGTRVYVTNFSSNTLSVLDTVSNTVITTVRVGGLPNGVAAHPAGTQVYVANNLDGTVSVIDTASNIVVATVRVGNRPDGVAAHPQGTRVYVANKPDNTVSVIDTATNTVTATVKVGGSPEGVAVNPEGTRVYVTNNSGSLSVIDTAANTVLATVAVQNFPTGVAVNPQGTRVYAAHFFSNIVSVIDTGKAETDPMHALITTVIVGNSPNGIAVHPTGGWVYAAIHNDDTVAVIDTATNRLVASVRVGNGPVAFGQFIGLSK